MAKERGINVGLRPQEVRVIDSSLLPLALRREKERRSEPGALGKIVKVIIGKK